MTIKLYKHIFRQTDTRRTRYMQTYWDVWTDCNTCRRWWNKTWMHSCAHSHKYMACLFVRTHMQLQIMYNGMIMAEQVFLHYSHWIVLALHLYCILLYCVSVSPVVGACVCIRTYNIFTVYPCLLTMSCTLATQCLSVMPRFVWLYWRKVS